MRIRNGNPDPVAGLRWRERRAWRRRERAIVTADQAQLAAALNALADAPVLAVTAGPTGTVTITVPGWSVGLAGVGASAGMALVGVAREACHLAGGGRYGRFWWLSVGVTAAATGPPVVVLGAAVRLHPAGGDNRGPAEPGLTPPAPRKEYSLR